MAAPVCVKFQSFQLSLLVGFRRAGADDSSFSLFSSFSPLPWLLAVSAGSGFVFSTLVCTTRHTHGVSEINIIRVKLKVQRNIKLFHYLLASSSLQIWASRKLTRWQPQRRQQFQRWDLVALDPSQWHPAEMDRIQVTYYSKDTIPTADTFWLYYSRIF